MHSESPLDCYCKSCVPVADPKNEIHSGRGRAKLLTSKISIRKTEEAVRPAKKVPTTSARLVDEDQPATNRSAVALPVSPVLSPETSGILENVERLVKDAEIQIKEISMITNCNRTQTPIKVYSNEGPLDDETDQLLYIRERVAHKFQEANGWIGRDHADIRNQGYMNSENVPLKLTRTIDFSAPRFKSSEERYKELSRYGKLGVQKLGPSMPVADVPEARQNSKNPNEARPSSFEAEKNKKTDNFSVQVGPSVNIQRELIAQSIGDIHISPDSSFVPESTNVGTYMVRRDCSVKPNSPTRKAKFVQISEKNESAKGSRRAIGGRQRTRNSKVLSEPGSNIDSVHGSTSVEKPVKSPERSSDISLGSNERSLENVEKLHEAEAETMSSEDKENLVSTTSSDRRLNEDLTLQPPVRGSLAAKQEAEAVTRGINDSTKRSSELRSDQKQVRFNDKEPAANLEESPKGASESARLDIPATSKEIETGREDASPLCQGTEEQQKGRQRKIGKKEEQERNRRYRVIDERFSTVFKQYCSQNERCPKSGVYSVASSAESSEEAEESKDLDDLYDPSINELDNVLLAYSKMINDVVRSTRTIEKLLLKPEIEEYRLQNRATTETSESCSSTVLNESAVQVAKTNVSHLRAKRRVGPRTKDSVNKEPHSHKAMQTKTVKPAPTKSSLRAKGGTDGRKRHVAPETLGKCPPRGDPRVKERFSAPKKLLNEETTESSESGSNEAKGALESEEFPSGGPCSLRKGNDSLSLATFSINTLSSAADGRVQSADEANMPEAISGPSIGEVAEEITNSKPDATSTREIEAEDLQRGRFDYASLYNMVHSDVLKAGFPKLKDTPNIAEHLIARVLKEEAQFLEDKIRNTFNANQIVPVLMNGLLENLQSEALNTGSQSLELVISENVSTNDAASINVRAVETAGARSDKQNLQIQYPSSNGNFRVPGATDRDEKIIDEKACGGPNGEDDIHAETVDHRKSQQSPISDEDVSEMSHRDLSSDGRSKSDCDAESLQDDLNASNDGIDPDGNIRNVARLKYRLNKDFEVQGNGNDSSNSRSTCLRLANEEIDTASAVQKDMPRNVKKAANCASEAIDEPLIIGRNEEDQCGSCKDNAVSNQNLSPSNDVISEVKGEEKPVKYNLSEDEAKTMAQSSNNVHQMSSSDSLHNCASLQSSPRNISKQSLNAGGSSSRINEIGQFSARSNAVDGEVDEPRDQTGSFRGSVFNREKILSDLYDEVHRKVLLSAFDADHSSTPDQNGRLSKSTSTIGSNKVKTLSDTSHSEGELYMPSSGSYSLGEVRMLRKNGSDGEDTNGCDDSVTILLTKRMLTSWNESSKSLIQSMGEI
ncbi:uncharacterized protein LOC143365953 [Andrena cerasifolii]|uniref:uncharacterized protein LOC143365953 n=1 Tax=Andrena cerasifolii TaxID=2819439 RepID=UPI004037FB06